MLDFIAVFDNKLNEIEMNTMILRIIMLFVQLTYNPTFIQKIYTLTNEQTFFCLPQNFHFTNAIENIYFLIIIDFL